MISWKIKRIAYTIILFCIGLSLILYPYFSNYIYELQQSRHFKEYQQETLQLDDQIIEEELKKAHDYNETLQKSSVVLSDPFEADISQKSYLDDYTNILNFFDNGIMGYVDIKLMSISLYIMEQVKKFWKMVLDIWKIHLYQLGERVRMQSFLLMLD